MHRYTAEVRGAISMDIPVSVLFEGWQWAMSSYKTGHTKLVTNWKYQNKISIRWPCPPNPRIWIRLRISGL